jgi:2-polyprenyl-6-methoxyphenol hydroxylase-like FAD-dependent oxidoreductase
MRADEVKENTLTRAAIIGGGIAGLATGLFALKRQLSMRIYEGHKRLTCQDNLLWLAPNGLHLLAELGLMDEITKYGVAQEMMHFSSKKLRPLLSLNCQKLARTNGYPIIAIQRGKLYEIMLKRFLDLGGSVHYGHLLTAIREYDSSVELSFAEQVEPAKVDYVIGADGLGSRTRRCMFPGSSISYQGLRTYLGRSKTPVSSRFVGQTIEAWGNGTRFVLTSLDGVTTYWSAIERPRTYEKNSAPIPEDIIARLLQSFATFDPDILNVIEHGLVSSVHRCNFGVVTGLNKFHTDRVCLVGDAAHGMPPNMGQGASLALEDAYELTTGLASAAAPAEVFSQFDRSRRPRAKQMMQLANSMNTLFQPKSRLGSGLRNCAASIFPDQLSQHRMADLYRLPFGVPSALGVLS